MTTHRNDMHTRQRNEARGQADYAPLKAAATLPRRLGRVEVGADGGSADADDDGGFIFQASSAYALRLVAVSTFGFGVMPVMLRCVRS